MAAAEYSVQGVAMANRSFPSGQYVLEIDGYPIAGFAALEAPTAPGTPPRPLGPQELALLVTRTAQSADDGRYVLTSVRHSATSRTSRQLTLMRGSGDGIRLHHWSSTALPRTAIIATPAMAGRYRLENAWPVKWYVPTGATSDGDVAIKELVLAYERLQRI